MKKQYNIRVKKQRKERTDNKVKLTEFNYVLPERLIAQVPIEKRDDSRLMVLDR